MLTLELFDIPIIREAPCIWIAFSGGMDSMVLLHMAMQAKHSSLIRQLQIIHIHHGLNSEADQWADFCKTYCTSLDLSCHIQQANIQTKGGNIEAKAREARYQLLTEKLQEKDCLLMGHHQNDQAETVLFRAARGSDVYGLQGIPKIRKIGKGLLFRPLLSFSKKTILTYAHQHQLNWVEDPSNDSLKHDRNIIRHQILPQLQKRWPQISKSLTQVAQHAQWAQIVLNETAHQDLKTIAQTIKIPFLGSVEALYWPNLIHFSSARKINCLLYWLREKQYNILNIKNAAALIDTILHTSSDKQPYIICHGAYLRRYEKWLVLDKISQYDQKISQLSFYLQDQHIVPISQNRHLFITKNRSKLKQGLSIDNTYLTVTSRMHVNKLPTFSIHNRQGKKSLKKWFYEFKIPYWIRDTIPILIYDQEIVMIPNLAINEKFMSQSSKASWDIVIA
ncbi:MAG: tRNA lysidine(34) synthetase TilS [Endozoicomonadaceae bacterium]|nr:tRNA lysidine(34) synthetase TilS [Endozoicomonadaceae bacterium]MBE8232652.1 tRNA lysidine(34) synthetase TilS [Endozoicomonadaceae bacterium]